VAAPKKPANNAPVFGRWQAIRPIGRGGFGQTIEVKHLDTSKFAIVKVINSDHYGDDYHDYVRRFEREIKFLSEMDHPNICRLYEANFDGDEPWFAMERYKGNTVAEELEQYGPAPEKIWFDRARDILSALKYAHSKKIIHGDLNPGNVIIDGRGAKLIDFGIARRDGNYSSNSTRIFGANGWTSPQYGAFQPSVHDDIFVAASLLVLLGTGHHAFKANTVNNFLPSIVDDEPDYRGLSTNQIQLLRNMHQKSREKRCSAASALSDIDRLEPSATSRPIVAKAGKAPVAKNQDNFQRKINKVNEAGDLAKIAFLNPFDLAKDSRVQDGVKAALKHKGLAAATFLLGGVPLVAYWIISKMKRTQNLNYSQKFPLAMSSLAYFLTFGILSPIATIWWGRRLGFQSLKLALATQTFFALFVLLGTIAEANQEPSVFLSVLRIIGFVIGVIGYKKVTNKLLSPIEHSPAEDGQGEDSVPEVPAAIADLCKDKNGTPIKPGSKLRYEKKDVILEGVFSRYDKNSGYVWIKVADGKKPVVFSTKYVTVIGDHLGNGEIGSAPPTTKVEIRESDGGSQIVGTQRSWAEVETFFVQALSNKRGKRFIFEIESDAYTDIYFQGYSEPDLSRTIEAAADLSVRPKLTDAQKLSMSVIGWDLPSEDLPNFIMFLESAESGDRSLAAIFARTLREGYGLELGTFRVLAPVR
jgi:serine/threonine protein kinase